VTEKGILIEVDPRRRPAVELSASQGGLSFRAAQPLWQRPARFLD
jgi:hypothetical protein